MKLIYASTLAFISHQILLLIHEDAVVAALACHEPCLYYAELTSIRRVQLQNNTGVPASGATITTIYNKGRHINAIAIDRFKGRIFWYDIFTRMIYRASLDGSRSQVIVKYGVSFCEGITYDWSTDNIYWTDTWHNWIGVASSDGKNQKALITGNMENPFGIVSEPNEGYLFWTVLGKIPRIERARLDGTERTSIVTTGLYLPNDLQIDYSARRILWIDAVSDKVESSDFDGKNRVILTDVAYFGAVLMHPYSMAFFPQHSVVYFTDWYRSWVIYKTTSANIMRILYRSIPRILEIGHIRILHHSIQPPATSPCLHNKGNCSHMCLKQNARGYSCHCPTGMTLATNSSNQCQGAALDYHIFVVDGSGSNGKILHLSKFIGQPEYQFSVAKLPQSGLPVGMDFDENEELIYWTDVRLNKIFKMHFNGSGFGTITDKGLETPETVQIDTASGLLYVADYNYEKIEVIKTDGSMRMDLITTDLRNPRDIVLYHEKGIMFFSDWSQTKPKIESAYMDGTNRKYIISSDTTAPSGLAIDKIEQRLYWCDMALDRIESSDLDGTNRRVLFDHDHYNPYIPIESVTGEIQLPYGLTLHQDKVFWTDWQRKAVYSADKRIGSKINYITRGLEKPMQVHAYSKRRIKEYKKKYFFSRATISGTSSQTHSCFSGNCTGTFTEEPKQCPVGYKQTSYGEVCANCSAPFGVYNFRCECKNWMSCAHRAYSKLFCPEANPFMQFKVRECTQVVNPGRCPNAECPKGSGTNCTADGDCLDTQKCCNTTCGMKCLSSATSPVKHQCQIINGGCSHFCLRIPNNFTCRCPIDMVLQPADKKTCISKTGLCAKKHPCLNGGVCKDNGNSDYTCTCKPGFFGKNCERCPECPYNITCTKMGEVPMCSCTSNVCKNNGTCTIVQNRTVCNCPPAFTGNKCETLIRCPDNTCNGHGTCIRQDGAFRCNCYSNYSGKKCEVFIPCMAKGCKNNGKCIAINGTAICNCSKQFTGAHCEIFSACVPNPCANGGICSNAGSKIACTCASGYTGNKCENRLVCHPNPCLNNGICYISGGNASCHCSDEFTGDRCQTHDPCKLSPCKNNATCLNNRRSAYCLCLPGFTGKHCGSSVLCHNDFCKNGGVCLISKNMRSCSCPVSYTGAYCETHKMCLPNPCQNDGKCSGIGVDSFNCSCPQGYAGKNCQYIDRCLSEPCKNGGSCTNVNSATGYMCTCVSDTTGQNCESTITACTNNPCLNSGTCQVEGAGYICKCTNGYKGVNCATRDYCASSNCRKSSLCVNGQTGYTCSCDAGYTGQDCSTTIDHCGGGNICNSNGVCVSTLLKAKCICDDYYGGETCEVYYGENMLQVTMSVVPSSNVTTESIKDTLASEYTNYCKTADCTTNIQAKRKRRNVKSSALVTSNDIMIPKGYPKSVQGSKMELYFAVIVNAGGKSFALPDSILSNGFTKAKDALERSLNIKVISFQTVKKPRVGKNTSGDKTDSSKGGLAAGLVVTALAVIFIIIVAVYALRKRRREKGSDIGFNTFDNVMYQSNCDLQGEQGPNVQINRSHDDGVTDSKKPIQFSNIIYDARKHYSEIENAAFGTSSEPPEGNSTVKMEIEDGMVGMINPYVEVLETEKKLAPISKEDSATIGSSTNLKAAALASLDDERGVQLERGKMLSRSFLNDDNEKPMMVKVRSISEDSGETLSGIANPCTAVDDYIFSEDDTREALDITGGSLDKRQIVDLNAITEQDRKKMLPSYEEATADYETLHWPEKEKNPNLESDA